MNQKNYQERYMSQAIAASLSSMESASRTAGIISGNIANSDTDGYKAFYTAYSDIVSSHGDLSQGVTATTMLKVDQQGNLRRTNVATDLTIDGNGFFPVTDSRLASKNIGKTDTVLFTKNGSFRKNKDGDFEDPSGHTLLAWELDADGALPANKSIMQSLTKVNIQRLVSEASATTKVDVAVNLDSSQAPVGGGQATMYIKGVDGNKQSPYNAFINSDQILYPNEYNSLTPGEGMTLKIADQTINMIYGGFVQSLEFSNTGTELTSATSGNATNDEFVITVQGNAMPPITRGAGATNLEVLQGIVDQLNLTTGAYALTARLVNDGTNSTILIAPKDSTFAMSFSGMPLFRNSLGFTDAKNIAAATNRFASFKNLADQLNKISGVNAIAANSGGATLTVKSAQPLFMSNYNPLGASSDFLKEFSMQQGYLPTSYNPYDSNNNMAGGGFKAHYSRDFTVYDSMGNSYNFLISFLKVDANKWATEIYSLDKTAVNIPGRVDGLLQAGYLTFYGDGTYKADLPTVQEALSKEISSPDMKLGATDGQKMNIQVETKNYSFTYHSGKVTGGSISGSGTALATGTGTDTITISSGATTFTFKRSDIATSGTNKNFLDSLATMINNTTGADAICAEVIDVGSGNYKLEVRSTDITKGLSFGGTTLNGDLGLTSAVDLTSDSSRFSTLYELQRRINETVDPYRITASIIQGVTFGTYRLIIKPMDSTSYMTFTGDSQTIGSPLGNGTTMTIHQALGLGNTNAQAQLSSLSDTMTVNWSSAINAKPNEIKFSFGSEGTLDGVSQIASNYSVRKIDQNGISSGELTNVQVDREGYIIANFSNSKSRKIYKAPVADFTNPNGLIPISGNVFAASKDSGPMNLKEAGQEGAGKIISGSIEGSNVDVSEELSKLMQVQRRFQASAKVINVEDKMNEELIHRTYA
jgi:flagellar hook protein FlgE